MSEYKRIHAHFEGRVHILDMGGRAVVIARELGDFLGYGSRGAQLVTILNDKWAEELIPDVDVLTLRGDPLAEFKQACQELGLGLVDKRAAALMLLTMSGVQLVLSRSEKPEGKAFRRWLVTEVIPAYERTKQVDGDPVPQVEATSPPAGGIAPPLDNDGGSNRRRGRRRPHASSAGGAAGGPPSPPGGGRRSPTPALPDPDRGAIWCHPGETTEEKLAAAFARGQELPRAAQADELVRGQVLRLMRSAGQRAALIAVLERLGGLRAPSVAGATHDWQVELTQAVWLVRRLTAETLVHAREEVGRLILERDPRDHQMVATLVALINVELSTLPEGVLVEVLAAVPRWRSGVERPIPLPVSA